MKRLAAFIVVCLVFLGFIVLNLQNTCNISFGFKTLNNVPVFLTVICSFILGMVFTIPMALASLGRQRKKLTAPKPPKKGGKDNVPAELEEVKFDGVKKEASPYGID